jgi:hypothetical protein
MHADAYFCAACAAAGQALACPDCGLLYCRGCAYQGVGGGFAFFDKNGRRRRHGGGKPGNTFCCTCCSY